MLARKLTSMMAGIIIGALTTKVLGKHVNEFVGEGARKVGEGLRHVADSFGKGFWSAGAAEPAADEPGETVEVVEEEE